MNNSDRNKNQIEARPRSPWILVHIQLKDRDQKTRAQEVQPYLCATSHVKLVVKQGVDIGGCNVELQICNLVEPMLGGASI